MDVTRARKKRCAPDQHVIVPDRNGFGRCSVCNDDSFPMTMEAVGVLPCCGGEADHAEGCDGKVRQPWALAKAAEQELERALGNLDFNMSKESIRRHLLAGLEQVRMIRWEGADPPPRNDRTALSLSE